MSLAVSLLDVHRDASAGGQRSLLEAYAATEVAGWLDGRAPLTRYFPPYDIDHRQPWTMHAGARGGRPMNALLFARWRSLLRRLDCLLAALPRAMTYTDYLG